MFTPPTKEQRESYVRREFTQATFLFLANLASFNLDSRRLMANAIQNAAYKPLLNRQGELANYDPLGRKQLLDVVTLEILAKLYMALEDLGKVLIAAQHPPAKFLRVFATLEQKKSLGVFRVLSSKSETDLYRIVPSWRSEQYGLTGEHAKAIDAYNTHTVRRISKLLAFVADFIDKHDAAYNRYKHGMPIIVGMKGEAPADGIDGPVMILRDGQNMRNSGLLMTGETVVERFVSLLNTVVELSTTLVRRRLQLAEFGGIPLPMLCLIHRQTDGSTKCETRLFAGFDPKLQPSLKEAFEQIMNRLARTEIVGKIECHADVAKIAELTAFYKQDWRID